jgi:hypothetical protein
MFNKDEMKFPGTRGPDWNRFGSKLLVHNNRIAA